MVRSELIKSTVSTRADEEPLTPLWKVEDVMKYLGDLGRDKVYDLVNSAGLPFILFGKQEYRFYPFAVRDWVKKQLQTK